jgi:hypothetical protein
MVCICKNNVDTKLRVVLNGNGNSYQMSVETAPSVADMLRESSPVTVLSTEEANCSAFLQQVFVFIEPVLFMQELGEVNH